MKAVEAIIEACLFLIIIFTPLFYGTLHLSAITVLHLLSFLILLLWLIKVINLGRIDFVRTPLDLPLIIFCGLSILSAFTSIYPPDSFAGCLLVLNYIFLYFVITNHINKRAQLNRVFLAIIYVGTFLALFHLLGGPIHILPSKHSAAFNVGGYLSGYLCLIMPLCLGKFLAVQRQEKKFLLIFISILIASSIILSGGVSTILALGSSFIFFGSFLLKQRQFKKDIWLLLFILALLTFSLFWLQKELIVEKLITFKDIKGPAITQMLSIWRSSFRMFLRHPFWGTGLGTFVYAFPKYRLPENHNLIVYAHNDFLQLLCEMGVIGLGVFLWCLIRFFRSTFSLFKRRKDLYVKGIVAGCLTSCFALLLNILFEFNLNIPAIAALFFIVIALTIVTIHHSEMRPELYQLPIFSFKLPFKKIAFPPKAGSAIGVIGDNLLRFSVVRKVFYTFLIHKKSTYYPVVVLLFCLGSWMILKPLIAEVHFKEALNLERSIRWDEAIHKYKRAIRFAPKNSSYFAKLAKVFAKRSIFAPNKKIWQDRATQAFRRAIELNPQNCDYYIELASFLANAGRFNEAISESKEALKIDPNNGIYWHFLGDLYLKSKNLEDTFSSYKRAISLYPDLFWEVAEKAVRLTKDYCKLKLLIPEEAEAHYMFAQYFDRIGLSAESEAEYLEAIRLGPHNLDYRKSFAISLSNHNGHKLAIEELDKALKEAKDKAAIHLLKAEVYSKMEDLDKTILEYQQALALKPKDAKVYFDMGLFLQNKNEISKAIEAFCTAISLSPPHEIKYREHFIDLCLKEKRYSEAVKELKRICQFNPENIDFRLHLAQVYEKLEMTEEAIQAYREILKFQPQNKEALSKIESLIESLKEAK